MLTLVLPCTATLLWVHESGGARHGGEAATTWNARGHPCETTDWSSKHSVWVRYVESVCDVVEGEGTGKRLITTTDFSFLFFAIILVPSLPGTYPRTSISLRAHLRLSSMYNLLVVLLTHVSFYDMAYIYQKAAWQRLLLIFEYSHKYLSLYLGSTNHNVLFGKKKRVRGRKFPEFGSSRGWWLMRITDQQTGSLHGALLAPSLSVSFPLYAEAPSVSFWRGGLIRPWIVTGLRRSDVNVRLWFSSRLFNNSLFGIQRKCMT